MKTPRQRRTPTPREATPREDEELLEISEVGTRGWIHGCMDGWMDGSIYVCVRLSIYVDRYMGFCIYIYIYTLCIFAYIMYITTWNQAIKISPLGPKLIGIHSFVCIYSGGDFMG